MIRLPHIVLSSLGDCLRSTPRLQRIVERAHTARPCPTAELLIELLDHADVAAPVLNQQHRWGHIDPETVRRVSGELWPRAIHSVPPKEEDQ